jgi:hypothetical protein
MLFGGLLPPGVVSVEAVEATGVRKAAAVGGGTYATKRRSAKPRSRSTVRASRF